MERSIWCSAVAIGLGLSACEAQAEEGYLGEPLLRLSGQATVNASTGGLPIKPALCFLGNTSHDEQERFDAGFLPTEVTDGFRDGPNAFLDTERLNVTIQEVESVGEFPTDFNVAVYVPPPASVIKRRINGEPRSAEGFLCAVRADHPDVAEAPFHAVTSDCDAQESGQSCTTRELWATRDSKRYYAESYECPDAHTDLQSCLLTTFGDSSVKREQYEYVVGGDTTRVLYLVDRAPADSFTAWWFGSRESLSPGFHVFRAELEEPNPERTVCFQEASFRSMADISGGEYVPGGPPKLTKEQIDKYLATPEVERESNLADHLRELCEPFDMREVSPGEPLSIVINRDVPTVDPSRTLP